MGKSHKSDWPVLFFGLLLVGALLTAFIPSPVRAQQPPLREGCRAVSKLEYDTAKREYILIRACTHKTSPVTLLFFLITPSGGDTGEPDGLMRGR